MTILEQALQSLQPGAPQTFGGVTILPLRARPVGPAVTLFYPEVVDIREQDGEATVGCIQVENLTDRPLLLLAGELLEGARQNRLVNASTLVAPRTRHDLKVSCVEQGRWAYGAAKGRRFTASGQTAPWHLRARATRRSSRSKLRRGAPEADQHTVWQDVDRFLHRKRVRSSTSDLMAATAHVGERIDEGGWAPAPEDVGAALFIGERLLGMEVFGQPQTWHSAHRRILSGVHFEVDEVASPPTDPHALLERLLQQLSGLTVQERDGDGCGVELHAEQGACHAVALLHEQALVHLRVALLPPEDDTPPAPRRRNHTYRRADRWIRRLWHTVERAHALDLVRDSLRLRGPHLVFPLRPLLADLPLLPPGQLPPIPHQIQAGLVAWRLSDVPDPAQLEAFLRRLTVVSGCAPYHTEQPTTPRWLSAAERAVDTCILQLAPLAPEPSA